jgi:hypothetical protein
MGAPYTQAFIQLKIDFFAAAMETAATSQEYSYDQGPPGQFAVKKGRLDQIQSSLKFWVAQMDKYYPSAFSVAPSIEFTEIDFKSG